MNIPVQKANHSKSDVSRSKVIDFLDRELRSNAGFSIREEYPSIFGEFPGGESLFIERAGRIVSHLGYLVREFQHPEYRMRVGLIGSVATSVEWQGHGLASVLVRQALGDLKRKGCAIAVLWSDLPDFYAPYGFVRAGRERDLSFSKASVPSTDLPALPYEPNKHGHFVWRLYLKHDTRLDRSLEESKFLCRIPKLKLFVTEEGTGISSYIAIQKGADFENYIHEWGGTPEAVTKNIAWVQRHVFPDKPLTLIAPSHRELGNLPAIAEKQWSGVVGLIKLVDISLLMSAYVGFLRARGHDAQWNRNASTLDIEGKTIGPKEEGDWLHFVFGGERLPVSELELPFFLWGFDSI